MVCPSCRSRLVSTQLKQGVTWVCPTCAGRAVTLSLLRRLVSRDFLNRLWQSARYGHGVGQRPCPSCVRAMTEVSGSSASGAPKLDVCTRCQIVWFDAGELERTPMPTAAQLDELEREAAAKRESTRRKAPVPATQYGWGEAPDEWWKIAAAFIGLPVERNVDRLKGLPWATWLLALGITVFSVLSFFDLERVVDEYGFIPAYPWRHGGLTFLTGFLLHGGVLHLVGNMYFLLIFGDNVEDVLGKGRYLGLIALAALAGDLLHMALDPSSTTPCIGASGGISAVIVFYALAFPHAKIGMLFRLFYFLYMRWIWISAWAALVLWILYQGLLAWLQVQGMSNVSALAHLGGAAIGFLFWLRWRFPLGASNRMVSHERPTS